MAVVKLATVLLIHGDTSRGQVLQTMLADAGYQVIGVSTSDEAKKAVESAPPDAIVVSADGSPSVTATSFSLLASSPIVRETPVVLVGQVELPVGGLPLPITVAPWPAKPQDLTVTVQRCLDQVSASRACPLLLNHGTKACLLYERNESSQRLASETVRIQEEERRKLGLELHDDIAQVMGNLILMIDASMAVAPQNDHRLQQYLAEARNTAKEGFRRVQRFSIELRPPILDDLGLAPTIVWYTERFTKETGMPVEVSLPDRLPPLDGEQQTALFRIMQEALNNARKHSHARQASVTVTTPWRRLRLTITDNGIGFQPSEVTEKMAQGIHLGMAGMRYRASLLDGSLEIISASGEGTSITVDIPLDRGSRPQSE